MDYLALIMQIALGLMLLLSAILKQLSLGDYVAIMSAVVIDVSGIGIVVSRGKCI